MLKYLYYTHKQKKRETKHNTRESHKISREKNKRRRKEQKGIINNEQNCNKYIPINNHFKLNEINSPINRHRVVDWIQKTISYMYIYTAYKELT